MNKLPMGLTIFAIINFIFAGWALINLFIIFIVHITKGNVITGELVYIILFSLIFDILLIISGIGFLKLNYKMGFLCGIIMSRFVLIYNLVINLVNGFEIANIILSVPQMVYFTVLFFMLIFNYREFFAKNEKN